MNRSEKDASHSNNFSFWPTNVPAPALIKVSSSSSSDSLVPATKKASQPAASFKPHKLMYPMKESLRDSVPNDDIVPPTKWVGLTPLDMVQKIVSLANESPDFSAELQFIGSSCLDIFLVSPKSNSCDARAGEKRKSDRIEDEIMDVDEDDNGVAEALAQSHGNLRLSDSVFKAWDMSNKSACLESLAKGFERIVVLDPKKEWCIPSYNRVQKAFASQVVQAANTDEVAMDFAVNRATIQMQALVAMASVEEPEPKGNRVLSSAKSLLALARPTTTFSSIGFEHRPKPACCPSVQNAKEKKDAFQAVMVIWLKHNFANPFPDDVMLNKLANYLILQVRCITVNKNDAKMLEGNSPAEYHRNMINITIEKISNWMVNIRTRKWRPSIEAAFDAKRPAALLLQDSIRVYDGKELRSIKKWDGDALFASDPLYSTPLKKWKKKGAEGKKAKAGAGKRRSIASGTCRGADTKKKSRAKSCVLNDATSPPVPDLSPMCEQLLMAAKSMVTSYAEI